MGYRHDNKKPMWFGSCRIDYNRFPAMIKWNSTRILKFDCLPAKIKMTLEGDYRGQDITAQLMVPPEACIGNVKTCFDVRVKLEGACKFCIDLPEELAECVRAGRFHVVLFSGCQECARCPIDFVAKREVKCVEKVEANNVCEACC